LLGHEVSQYVSLEALLSDPDIDLVYIATPPFLHYPQSKAALSAGKHVICEKPAALAIEHAIECRDLARSKNLLYVVNLMQRYNPLYHAVTSLIREKLLGDFLHGFFENYASDEFLPANHWFWDTQKSGGIFIEHSVHFYDMFAGWFGKGEVISAQKQTRAGYDHVCDKVQSVVRYDDSLVNFYHGFDQPKAMDRQELRLLFEKGEITLYEWVPTRLRMTALCKESMMDSVKQLFPTATIHFEESHEEEQIVRGRFKQIHYQYKILLDTGDTVQKQTLYQDLVTSMFTDQIQWIRDRNHKRLIDDNNAVTSLETAVAADEQALIISPKR
jgi:predicted dehydrogenase